jgi:radical SAM protein with 4Fe4S-binding SPASM domain
VQNDLEKILKTTRYDKNGGIINLPSLQRKTDLLKPKKAKTAYSRLERCLIKNSRKVNYLLDENGKYKCRNEKTPQVIRIGPTNRCTGQCYYCPREHIHEKGTGYMDFDLYEKIIFWAKKSGVKVVSFAFFGEPLLHPRIFDMIDLAHRSGLGLRISTNGIILNRATAEKLLSYPFDSIELSMDGYTREEYLRGKQVDMYDKTKENILYFLELAKRKRVKTVFNIHFVDIGHVSFANKIKYIRYWKKRLKGLRSHTSFYYEPHNWAGARSDLRDNLSSVDRVLGKFELKKPCVYVKGMNIDHNGDVYICTNDPAQKAVLGNINFLDFEKIYNGDERMKFLSANETGDFRDLNCAECTVNTIQPLLYAKKMIIRSIVNLLG